MVFSAETFVVPLHSAGSHFTGVQLDEFTEPATGIATEVTAFTAKAAAEHNKEQQPGGHGWHCGSPGVQTGLVDTFVLAKVEIFAASTEDGLQAAALALEVWHPPAV
ncbi:MAG: hypothetical protein R2828_27400 [Saprospiraceae bacterium]